MEIPDRTPDLLPGVEVSPEYGLQTFSRERICKVERLLLIEREKSKERGCLFRQTPSLITMIIVIRVSVSGEGY